MKFNVKLPVPLSVTDEMLNPPYKVPEVPSKRAHALALPLMTVSTGTDEVPATLLSVVVLMVDMI